MEASNFLVFNDRVVYTISVFLVVLLGLSTIVPFILSQVSSFDVKEIGVITLQILKLGEVSILVLIVYTVLYRRMSHFSENYQGLLTSTVGILMILHICLFIMATALLNTHIYLNYLSGRICKANNLLLVFLLLINIAQIVLWSKGWFITQPDHLMGRIVIWGYIIFILGYYGPVYAHVSSVSR